MIDDFGTEIGSQNIFGVGISWP